MRALLAFRPEDLGIDDPTMIECPSNDEIRQMLEDFHVEVLNHAGHHPPEGEDGTSDGEVKEEVQISWTERLLNLVRKKEENSGQDDKGSGHPGKNLLKVILMIKIIPSWP